MNKENLHKLLGGLKLLYVEDEELIAQVFLRALERFFGEVLYAQNGLAGLDLYRREKPDMIITDIRMSEMDGIEMSMKIRETDASIPIIITSAYNDVEFLHRSIEAGVSEYLVKPVNTRDMLSKLERLGVGIQDRKDAEMYRKKLKAETINQTEETIIRDIGDALPAPFVMMDGASVVHLNQAFLEMLQPEQIDKINETKKLTPLEETFQQRAGYVTSLEEVGSAPEKIIVKNDDNFGFYQVGRQNIMLQGGEKEVTLFYFYDVTNIEKQRLMIEYQKSKLESLNELLSGYYYRQLTENRKRKETAGEETPKKTLSGDGALRDSTNYADMMLEEEERNILRKSHTNKTTAVDYVQEIGSELVEEVVELHDTEKEIHTAVDRFSIFKEGEQVREAGYYLRQYASVVHSLIEFADLATALQVLGDFLHALEDAVCEKNEKKILLYMHNIVEDLSQWRLHIFENPDALDIHYLDSSLFSSCLQFQLELQPRDEEDGDDDLGLELF